MRFRSFGSTIPCRCSTLHSALDSTFPSELHPFYDEKAYNHGIPWNEAFHSLRHPANRHDLYYKAIASHSDNSPPRATTWDGPIQFNILRNRFTALFLILSPQLNLKDPTSLRNVMKRIVFLIGCISIYCHRNAYYLSRPSHSPSVDHLRGSRRTTRWHKPN
jgi:hypothetical protein